VNSSTHGLVPGFESILKCMTSKNFNWFLHVMLVYHVKHVLTRIKTCNQEHQSDEDKSDSSTTSDSESEEIHGSEDEEEMNEEVEREIDEEVEEDENEMDVDENEEIEDEENMVVNDELDSILYHPPRSPYGVQWTPVDSTWTEPEVSIRLTDYC